MHGLDDLWFIGDNSLATSYQKGFKKAKSEFYLKNNFEVTPFCSSKYTDTNANAISRIINIFAHTLNNSRRLPQYIIVLLDGDLIDYLGYFDTGIATFYGEWIEYLAEQFKQMITKRKDLQGKCLPRPKRSPNRSFIGLRLQRILDSQMNNDMRLIKIEL